MYFCRNLQVIFLGRCQLLLIRFVYSKWFRTKYYQDRPVPLSQPDTSFTLYWRHNEYVGVSNHQPHGCLLNRLSRRKSKKTSKLRVTGRCAGNSPVPGQLRGKCFHLMTSSFTILTDIMASHKSNYMAFQLRSCNYFIRALNVAAGLANPCWWRGWWKKTKITTVTGL